MRKINSKNITCLIWTTATALVVLLTLCVVLDAGAATRLRRVEELTKSEQLKLQIATDNLKLAARQLEKVKQEIVEAHKMKTESYMEYSWKAVIKDGFILQYHKDFYESADERKN